VSREHGLRAFVPTSGIPATGLEAEGQLAIQSRGPWQRKHILEPVAVWDRCGIRAQVGEAADGGRGPFLWQPGEP